MRRGVSVEEDMVAAVTSKRMSKDNNIGSLTVFELNHQRRLDFEIQSMFFIISISMSSACVISRMASLSMYRPGI
jgi:hypothetical protein